MALVLSVAGPAEARVPTAQASRRLAAVQYVARVWYV
jgi:hypothetical protein